MIVSKKALLSACLSGHYLTFKSKNFDFFFCRWNTDQQNGTNNETEGSLSNIYGFGSISRRQSCKPIIAAVIGGAYGGGVEMILNCDLVVASQDSRFALPEVKRGVVAIQGGKYSAIFFFFWVGHAKRTSPPFPLFCYLTLTDTTLYLRHTPTLANSWTPGKIYNQSWRDYATKCPFL